MEIELTIKTTYLPNWGVYEGVRELIQNGKDAETEFGAPLVVTHYNNTLRIENEGCTLPHEALLFGHTTKQDRSDTIGKFGEGLKLGVLALVRAGRAVKIRSGDEVWIPTIAKSKKFNSDVLVFDILTGREPKNRVRAEIAGVTESEWTELREKFLFLADRQDAAQVIHTSSGDLLLAEKNKGKLFVKGIYVQTHPALQYGYDLFDVDIDRDRRMVQSWDISFRTNRIWHLAAAARPDIFDNFLGLVQSGKEDVKGMDAYAVGCVSQDVLTKVAEDFRNRYGKDAVPVGSLSESAEIEHLGCRGIVVNSQMAALLAPTVGNADKAKSRLATEILTTYSACDLTSQEQATLTHVTALLAASGVCQSPEIDVVDFRSPSLQGQYKAGKSSLSRKVLADRNTTLLVLVHEIAHAVGSDGEKSHVAAIEDCWSKIVAYLQSVIE